MASYYIDYENVHNEGLKGIDKLSQGDRLNMFYSNKADTLKIDVVRQLMECQAEVRFDKILNGVENALDFQLITALMCNYVPEENYYIISRDKGYDAAIEMAGKQQRENIYRCRDIDGAIKHQEGLGIDESDQEVIVDLEVDNDNVKSIAVEPVRVDASPYGEAAAEPVYGGLFWETPEAESSEPAAEAKPETEPETRVEAGAEHAEYAGDAAVAVADVADVADAEEAPAVGAVDAAEAVEQQTESEPAEASEAQPQAEAPAEPDQEELNRRAYQSMCTKIMNHIKLVHKIPLNYRQAGEIYEALMDSESKMQFYHRLLQSMGRKKGSELYQKVKAVYKSIRGLYQSAVEAEVAAKSEPEQPEAREVEAVRDAFEQAEQLQGNPGEAILQMVELVKKK